MVSSTVSVIIPCYKGDRFLAETLDTVLAQTHPVDEIIVVDDGSPIPVKNIVDRYPTVQYIWQANQGVAAARNTGIQASTGNYLVFLDHDDRLLPQAIEISLQSFEEHPDCGFITGLCVCIDGNGTRDPNYAHPAIVDIINYETLLRGECIPTPAPVMFKRQAIEQVGIFNVALTQACDDYDIYLRLAQVFPAYCHNQVVAEYRHHGDNMTATAGSSRFLVTTLQIYKEQWQFAKTRPNYKTAHRDGLKHWITLYGPYLVHESIGWLKKKQLSKAAMALWLALRYYPQSFALYIRDYSGKLMHQFKLTPKEI